MPVSQPIAVNPGMKQLKPGDHLCLLYENIMEWDEVIPPYLEYGLKHQQRCLYLGNEHNANRVSRYLREMGWDVADVVESGRLTFISEMPGYFKFNGNRLETLISFLKDQIELTRSLGYPVLRVTQEAAWLFQNSSRWSEFLEYEARLNDEICGHFPVLMVCQYQRSNFIPTTLKNVVVNHPLISRYGKIYRNSYYVEPEDYLSKHRDERQLETWFNHIERDNERSRRLHFLAELTERSSQPFMVIDAEGHILASNPAFCRLIGYDSLEIDKVNWMFDLTPPQWWEADRKVLARLLIDDESQRVTKEFVRKDGTRIPVEIQVEPITLGDGGRRVYYAMVTDISERLRMEQRLRDSETRYRSLVDNMQEGIYLLGPDLKAVFYNPAMEGIYGRTVEFLLENHPQSFLECVLPEDRERVARVLYHDIKLFERVETTYRVQRPSGEIRYLSDVLYTVRNQKGEIMGYQGLVCDVTEQTLNEMALKESEARLRQITDNMLDMIWKTDAKGVFEYVSPSHFDNMGYLPQDMLGTRFLDYVHPDDLDDVMEKLNVLTATHSSGMVVFRFRDASGNYRWLESAGNLLFDENKHLLGAIFACRDISMRRAAEEALRMAEQEKAIILDAMSEMVVHMDTQFNVLWANPVAMNWGKAASNGLEGRKCYEGWFGRQTPCDKCLVRDTLVTGEGQQGEVLTKDGRIWMQRTYPVLSSEGSVIGVVLSGMDVTERTQLQREMMRLQQLNLVGEMAAGIGHEIRNPMTTVRGFLQLLSQEKSCQEFVGHFDLMIEELDRANSIITEFLSLAKDRVINLKVHNLNQVLTTIYPLMAAEAIKEDKEVKLELTEIPDILLDEQQMRQLILNLVRNGLEAMATGGILTIRTRLENGEVLLTVHDQGSGIDEQILSKLGTPFFTTKTNGTGLGLAVCYSIAARHHARIHVTTGSDGTTFEVRFPLTHK